MRNLAAIGLTLDIIGVILLFFWSPPIPTVFRDGSEVLWYGEGGKEQEQKAKIAERRIDISKFALSIIIVGFVFQLFSQFTPKKYNQPSGCNYTDTGNKEVKPPEAKIPLKKPK